MNDRFRDDAWCKQFWEILISANVLSVFYRLEGNGRQLADDYRFNALKRKGVDLIKYLYTTVWDMEYIVESDAHVKS